MSFLKFMVGKRPVTKKTLTSGVSPDGYDHFGMEIDDNVVALNSQQNYSEGNQTTHYGYCDSNVIALNSQQNYTVVSNHGFLMKLS